MTFRTLLVVAALFAPMVALAADPKADQKEEDKPADLRIAVKLGQVKSVIIAGAREVKMADKTVAAVSMGEPNQVMVEALGLGETSAQITRRGEPSFKLVVQVVR